MEKGSCSCGCCCGRADEPNAAKAAAESAAAGANIVTSSFIVEGLDCADCAAKLEKILAAMPGVYGVNINFAAGKMMVEHAGDEAAIIKATGRAGYKAVAGSGAPEPAAGRGAAARTWATAAAGVFLVIAAMADWAGAAETLTRSLYFLSIAAGGYHVARSGLFALRSFTLDMNFLMTVAVLGAVAIGEWSEGATVVFLFSFGNMLQSYTMDKTRRAIRGLMDLAPAEALVRRGGREELLAVAKIVVGDIMIVRPGERIAMDGVVRGGRSAVNEAAITGESLPVEKGEGDAVYAGTVNRQGALEIEVTRIAADSTLARIMHMVEEAQAQKAPSQQFVDVFARYYTPAVLAAAAGVTVLPPLIWGEPFAPWFYKGLVLLVISCPCALVISTPVSIVSAIGNASRAGVLIKGGAYLEKLGSVRAVAFDKTGTMTYGRPVVTDIVPLEAADRAEVIAAAAAVEKRSEHPLGQAVVAAAAAEPKAAVNFEALTGLGAKAEVDGDTVYVGNVRLFEELGHSLAAHSGEIGRLQVQGKTVILTGTRERLYGLIAVADTLREESGPAIAELRKAGVGHIAMLTGDNAAVAAAIAAATGVDAHYSELLPEDKVAAIRDIRRRWGSTAMIGDGVNDAPALAAADIGVAMGVAGSDAALETADVALMADDLGKLAYIIRLSRKTVAVIKQNIIFAVALKALFVALTFAGMANLWLAVFADTGASLLVTLNGMRLMRRLG